MVLQRFRVLGRAALAVAVIAGVTVAARPAGAAAAMRLKIDRTLPGSYLAPLQFAVGDTTAYVADSFAWALFESDRHEAVATGPIDAVAVNRTTGDIAYTSTDPVTDVALLHIRHGRTTRTVRLDAYERAHNPDLRMRYGVEGTPSECVRQGLKRAGLPVQYNGRVESRPASVAAFANDSWLVADPSSNDILQVHKSGAIELLAVMPSVTVRISPAFAARTGMPTCVVGVSYRFEGDPTDIEVGANNRLYVSTLPGGEMPRRGKVYSIAPRTHTMTEIARGIDLGGNLAVDADGDVFVAELGTSDVRLIRDGAMTTVIHLPGLAGLEFAHGHLYASTAPALSGSDEPGHVYRLVQNGPR